MRYRVARSARRHKIGNAHIVAALESDNAEIVERRENGAQLIIATDDRVLSWRSESALWWKTPT